MHKPFKLGLLALGLAVFLDLVMYQHTPGLNLPLASLAFLGSTYLAMYIGGHTLPLRAHVAAVFSFLFALPFALGTSDQMFLLSMLGFLSAHLLFAAFAVGHHDHFNHPLEILWSGTGALGIKLLGRLGFLGQLKPPAFSQKNWAVGKGVLTLIPLLVIFILLFASADPVFRSYFGNIQNWLGTWSNPTDIGVQVFAIACLFTGIAPFFGAAAYERYPHETRTERPTAWHVESKIILAGLAALFAVFLILQASVMFGGSAAFAKLDLTYAEYARQGFNQLIFASALVAMIVLTLRDRHGVKTDNLLTGLHATLIIETLLVLVSASLRLNLYISTYGYTDARLFAYWAIITIGVLMVLLLANVLQRESQAVLMRRSLVVLGLCALVFCYSMPDAWATRLNFRRADAGQAFDLNNLQTVSAEAVPVIVNRLTSAEAPGFVDLDSQASVQDYCQAFAGNTTLAKADRDRIANDYQVRLRTKLWLAKDNYTPQQNLDRYDWRDWNYATVRANDVLPAQSPAWLNIPDIKAGSADCAPFVPATPVGVIPSERKR